MTRDNHDGLHGVVVLMPNGSTPMPARRYRKRFMDLEHLVHRIGSPPRWRSIRRDHAWTRKEPA